MRQKLLSVFAAILLLLIVPLSWDSFTPQSRTAMVVLLPITGAIWLLLRWQSSQPFRLPRVALPFLIFLLFETILLIRTPLPIYGIYWVVSGLMVYLGFLFLVDHSSAACENRLWENILIAVGLIMVSGDALLILARQWRWMTISGVFFSLPPFSQRVAGIFFGSPNHVGGFINILIPLTLVRLADRTGKAQRFGWLGALLVLLLLHYASASRAAWMALAGSLLVMLALQYAHKIMLQFGQKSDLPLTHIPKKFILIGSITLIVLLLTAPLLIRQIKIGQHGTPAQRVDIWIYGLSLVKASPLWGHGPGSIPFLFALRSEAIGVDEVFHTHNILLETTATTGMIGLAILLWGVALTLRAFLAAWRDAAPGSSERASLVAYGGIFSAVVIQGLVDFLFSSFKFNINVFVILALLYRLAPKSEFYALLKKQALPALAALLCLGSLGVCASVQGFPAFGEGQQVAVSGNWRAARDSICQITQGKSSYTFYLFQCSLSTAIVVYENDNQQSLQSAFEYQAQGLKKDPFWYVHWVNLASYEWQLGYHDLALQHMGKAAAMAPKINWLWLNLGWMEESLNREEDALEHYTIAFCLNPWYRLSKFFENTSLRRQVLQAECPQDDDTLAKNTSQRIFWEGMSALQVNDLSAAEHSFSQSVQANRLDPVTYAYLALVHQQLGETTQAWKDIQTALFITDTNTRVHLIAAQLAEEQGKEDQAFHHLFKAFELVSNPIASPIYYIRVYRIVGLPTDLSPFLISAPTPDLITGMLKLAAMLQQEGKIEKSLEVRRWIEKKSLSGDLLDITTP